MINLTGKNKAEVLAKLYNASKPLGMGFFQATPEDMSTEEAQKILDTGDTYFDYLRGRVMKVNLIGDEFNPDLYDRDNGQGAAEAAINS